MRLYEEALLYEARGDLLRRLAKRKAVHFGPSLIMDSQAPETFYDEESFRLRMEQLRKYMKRERIQRKCLIIVSFMLLALGSTLLHLLYGCGR